MNHDPVNHPKHYTSHPSGVECIQITEHMGFCLGNVLKYVWRADLKGGVEDLLKAQFYLAREIAKRTEDQSSKRKDGAESLNPGSSPGWPSAYLERKLE